MKLIILSSPVPFTNELQIINSMFEEGLEMFHVHKPLLSKGEIEKFIRQIPEHFQDRVHIHSYFPKFHSLEELKRYRPTSTAQIAFLSPIFESISKPGYRSEFSDQLNKFTRLKPELITDIKGKNIIALGGINTDKIELTRKIGFKGVASLGAIWTSKNPLQKFIDMNNVCNSKAFLGREMFLEEFKPASSKSEQRPIHG